MVKILLVAVNCFSKLYNNGKTYEAIFSGFNMDELNQLCFNYSVVSEGDFEFCRNYYVVSESDFFRISSGKSLNRPEVFEEAIQTQKRGVLGNKLLSVKYKSLFRDCIWGTGFWRSKKLKTWVKNTGADVVFFVGGSAGGFHSIARYVAKYLNVPLATYFTDDYLIYPIDNDIIERFQTWRMKRFYKRTINASSLLFCIGEKMSAEYTAYFGRQFNPIMNMTPVVPYVKKLISQRPVIAYFGGLHLGRWQMIARLSDVVKEFATVHVYSFSDITPEIDAAFKSSGVVYKGGLQGEALKTTMHDSDVLLHVESDDAYYRSRTRLSVSTKIPEYLMTGRPVIGFGPTEVASMCLLSDNNIGLVIPCDAADVCIETRVRNLIEDQDAYDALSLRAYEYAVEHFDKDKVAKRFKEQLLALI